MTPPPPAPICALAPGIPRILIWNLEQEPPALPSSWSGHCSPNAWLAVGGFLKAQTLRFQSGRFWFKRLGWDGMGQDWGSALERALEGFSGLSSLLKVDGGLHAGPPSTDSDPCNGCLGQGKGGLLQMNPREQGLRLGLSTELQQRRERVVGGGCGAWAGLKL